MSNVIRIVPYDPNWPRVYEEEKPVILQQVGHIVCSINHIGSTSVPGLAAKPIVDIIAGVDGKDSG